MIDVSAENLRREVEYAERVRDKRLSVFKSQLKGYTSAFFKSESGEQSDSRMDYNPENHLYEFFRQMVPQMVMHNPRIRLGSRVYGLDVIVSELREYVNQWVMDEDYAKSVTPSAHDALFNFAASKVTVEDHPYITLEDGSPARTPKRERISQWHFFRDPIAKTPEEARYEGHKWVIDKDDLVSLAEDNPEQGWILSEVKALAENTEVSELKSRPSEADAPDRKEVVCIDVWVKDHVTEDSEGPEEGFHGTIFTIGVGVTSDGEPEARQLRDPRPFFGPPTGPYHSCSGFYYVPDDPFGLAPAVAVEGQIRDLNRHARGSSDAAARYKRLVMVDDTDPSLVEHVTDKNYDTVLPVTGFDKNKVVQVELGGITDQNLTYLQVARERLERVSGLSEAQRGAVTGKGTATELALANEAADAAVDFIKTQWTRYIVSELSAVLWYGYMDTSVRQSISPALAVEMGIPVEPGQTLMFQGGEAAIPQFDEMGQVIGEDRVPYREVLPFDQLALEIEPMSMERSSEGMAQQKAMGAFQLVTQLSTILPQIALYTNIDQLLETLGEGFNLPFLSDVFDADAARQVGMMMMMGQPGDGSGPNKGGPEGSNPLSKSPPPLNFQPLGDGGGGPQMGPQLPGNATGAKVGEANKA